MSKETSTRSVTGVGCAVLTISDTRTLASDSSGRAIVELLEEAGQRVLARHIARDEPAQVTGIVRDWSGQPDIRVIVATGGTGISRRDSTFEAVGGLFDKPIPGFGELFRYLSFQEIGAAAMLSRAAAGTMGGTALFLLPGSEAAVRLALTRLIVPQLGHLVSELDR